MKCHTASRLFFPGGMGEGIRKVKVKGFLGQDKNTGTLKNGSCWSQKYVQVQDDVASLTDHKIANE